MRHLVFNIVNNAPPMIAISAQRAGGKRKDTAINIENGQSFVVHVTDEDNVEEINKTASINPKDNELDLTELNTISSDLIDIPIKEAKIRFECQLEQMILLGSEDDGAI